MENVNNLVRALDLNERGKQLLLAQRSGGTLYVFQAGGIYHPVGQEYDDVRVSLCRKVSGRVGRYGVTDDVSGMELCAECEALLNQGA
jgi:hypothetical protein